MKRLLLVSALFLSSTAWADIPPGPSCNCASASDVPLALLVGLAAWAARRK